MRAIVQRVTHATLTVVEDGVERERAAIGPGLVALAGVEKDDTDSDAEWMGAKIAHLRIFEDDQERMNRSVLDEGGSVLLVPNFTVAGDARKGRRPSFDNAMPPPEAEAMFDALAAGVRAAGVEVATGVFGAHMRVSLVNDGPVTIWLDSRA